MKGPCKVALGSRPQDQVKDERKDFRVPVTCYRFTQESQYGLKGRRRGLLTGVPFD